MNELLQSISEQVDTMEAQTGYRLLRLSEYLYLWHRDRSPIHLSLRNENVINVDARLLSVSCCEMKPDDPRIKVIAGIGRAITGAHQDARLLYYSGSGDLYARLTLPIINGRMDESAFLGVIADLMEIQDEFEEAITELVDNVRDDSDISLYLLATDYDKLAKRKTSIPPASDTNTSENYANVTASVF